MDKIKIRGANENNLKNVDLEFPRNKLVVFTGVSGSGKSSLAFNTIFADGQRRYLEGLSSYVRQFLGKMEKPKVESIEGLSPAISIDQKTTSKNPRSTVGTVTEIYDYLRLLYARVGVPHCPKCGKKIERQTVDEVVEHILNFPKGCQIQILGSIARGKKGTFVKEVEELKKDGFTRIRVDGEIARILEFKELNKNKKHNVEVVIDRLVVENGNRSRIAEGVETGFKISNGLVIVNLENGEDVMFSEDYACSEHGISVEKLSPKMFSFNSPYGACELCSGLGFLSKISPELIVPDENLSIAEGAIKAPGWVYSKNGGFYGAYYEALAKAYGFSLEVPFKELSNEIRNLLFYGNNGEKIKVVRKNDFVDGVFDVGFEGIINNLERRLNESKSEAVRSSISQYMTEVVCPKCFGKKLKDVVLGVTVGNKNIDEITKLSILDSIGFFENIKFSEMDRKISEAIIKEIVERLNFLKSVGLDYLTLARQSRTLSGGESQRIRLAKQIGSSLVGVLYVLDEPSIGLHQKDNDRLIATLKNLRDVGNSLIVVEHDEDTVKAADWIVDIGPGAGIHGGNVVFSGPVSLIGSCEDSLTGQYLTGKKFISVPKKRREGSGKYLEFFGCCENNLKNVDVKIKLETFTCITGVSGSGKSSLLNQIIYKFLACKLNKAKLKPGKFKKAEGFLNLDKVININQSPIGRTPRSNPGTYTSVFDDIRELFAATKDSKLHGFSSSRFSFNVKGGRCEACRGDGIVKIEMHFLPDVYLPCEVCKGKRYNEETLKVKYKGKNINDVLNMTVEEAVDFFENCPKIKRKLQALFDVGLSYVKIGQSAVTLSGGEAQRVKLATELAKKATGKTIYILDEPTTGLHTDDVKKLINILQKLVDLKNTVVLIEHNLDVIKTADYLIDLGPLGGKNGGEIIAAGTPEQVAKVEESFTGKYLKKVL